MSLLLIDADPTRIVQVFVNLLNNAAKFTARGGKIWLTAQRQGDTAVISVRDTGVGISEAHLDSVFDMFSQPTAALYRTEGGLGIGLAIVRGLVELHGGSVQARSAGPDKGSEFIVRLPLLEASRRYAADEQQPAVSLGQVEHAQAHPGSRRQPRCCVVAVPVPRDARTRGAGGARRR